jgi:Fe-S-cluster-containing dehydrogenase component
MARAFVVDVGRCCGCYNCQLACKDEHAGNDWTPYAKPQPDTGQFWMRIQENVCGTVPKVKMHYVPTLCNHCDKPPCVDACSAGAIAKRDDGLVIIEPEKCTGCRECMTDAACPYGVIYFNDDLGLAQKCTGCAHLLDNGYALPRCVESCPTDALRFGEEEELRDLIEGATVLKPEMGTRPRAYYRNIPGKFITGTVYDPGAREVVIGGRCLLTSGGKLVETFTDAYGDFWFRDLAVGTYDVRIEAVGFEGASFPGLNTGKDVNLGEIPLTPRA